MPNHPDPNANMVILPDSALHQSPPHSIDTCANVDQPEQGGGHNRGNRVPAVWMAQAVSVTHTKRVSPDAHNISDVIGAS